MSTDELKADIAHQHELISNHKRALRVLENQAARFGMHVPPYIQIEIEDLNEKIQSCQVEATRLTQQLTLEEAQEEVEAYRRRELEEQDAEIRRQAEEIRRDAETRRRSQPREAKKTEEQQPKVEPSSTEGQTGSTGTRGKAEQRDQPAGRIPVDPGPSPSEQARNRPSVNPRPTTQNQTRGKPQNRPASPFIPAHKKEQKSGWLRLLIRFARPPTSSARQAFGFLAWPLCLFLLVWAKDSLDIKYGLLLFLYYVSGTLIMLKILFLIWWPWEDK